MVTTGRPATATGSCRRSLVVLASLAFVLVAAGWLSIRSVGSLPPPVSQDVVNAHLKGSQRTGPSSSAGHGAPAAAASTPDADAAGTPYAGDADPVSILPLCTSNPAPGSWQCPLFANDTRVQPSSTCFVSPSPWRPDNCTLLPPLRRSESRQDEVCRTLSTYNTVTFIGDSFVRNVFVALLLQANTAPFPVRCTADGANASIPLNATSLVSCSRGEQRFVGSCNKPPPQCCDGTATISTIGNFRSQWQARSHQQVFTKSLPQFCGGHLEAYMIRIYRWGRGDAVKSSKYARHHLHMLRNTPGRHLLVLGAGIHYLDGATAMAAATKAMPYFRDVLNKAGLKASDRARGFPPPRGVFTAVLLPVHYRSPPGRYVTYQGNDRTRGLMNYIITECDRVHGPIQNEWRGAVGTQPAPDRAPKKHAGTAAPAATTNVTPAVEDGQAVPDPYPRLLVLDTWRLTRQLVDHCPHGFHPFPDDGSHFRGAGEMLQARLLLNTIIDDEEKRAAGIVASPRGHQPWILQEHIDRAAKAEEKARRKKRAQKRKKRKRKKKRGHKLL